MINRKKITLADIAKSAGVSLMTASRVLRGTGSHSIEVKERILKIARELGFKKKSTNLLGNLNGIVRVILPKYGSLNHVLYDAFSSSLLLSIEQELMLHRFKIILSTIDVSEKNYNTIKQNLDDSLIIPSLVLATDLPKDILESILDISKEVVCFNSNYPSINHIEIDNYSGGYSAGEFLIKNNFKKPIIVSHSEKSKTWTDRAQGFTDAIEVNLNKINQIPIFQVNAWNPDCQEVVNFVIKNKSQVDCIFGLNDTIAIAVMEALQSKNILIPENLSVIGFDNNYASSMCKPKLTTMAVHWEFIGKKMTRLLLELIQNPTDQSTKVSITPELCIRESVKT